MIGALTVCEITKILVVKYRAKNLENNIGFSILFFSNNINGVLYLAMMNKYFALSIRFALPGLHHIL